MQGTLAAGPGCSDKNSAGRYPLISRPMQTSTRVGVVHAMMFASDGTGQAVPCHRLRPPSDKVKSKIPDTAVSKAYADAPPAALPRRARAFPALRQSPRGGWGQPPGAL